MIALPGYSAFIFDMDGLVLDTESAYFEAWRQALETMGFQADLDYFRSFSGYRFAQVQEKLLEKFGMDFDMQKFKELGGQFWRDHVDSYGINLKPGVIELLDFAESKSIPYCIATNSPALNAHECLELAGIKHRFQFIVTGDDVGRPKPAPDIFLKAAGRLGVDIDRCIVFEDSHTGIVAATEAGAYSVYIPSTFPVDPLTVELCNCKADDLLQVCQSLAMSLVIGI